MGLSYVPLDLTGFVLLALFAAFPAAALPVYFARPGDVIVWILFFFCYVPSITLIIASGLLTFERLVLYLISYCVGMIVIIRLSALKLPMLKRPLLKPAVFVSVLVIIYLSLNAWIILENHSTMRLVGWGDTYTQRFAGASNIGTSGYALGMVAGAVNPMLLSYGLYTKRRWLIALAVIGQVLAYMVLAQKFIFLSLIYIPAFYFLFGGRDSLLRPRPVKLIWIGVSFIVVLALGMVCWIFSVSTNSPFLEDLAALLVMRLVLLPGALSAQYSFFFENNPLTYMTHVGFGRLFFTSPYGPELGLVIGSFLADGGDGMNANVNFFANDGTASFGVIGPTIMGVVVGATISFLNMIPRREHILICSVALTTFAFSLREGSYFATMLTTGGALGFILTFLLPKAKS